jgi:hypothetical protein
MLPIEFRELKSEDKAKKRKRGAAAVSLLSNLQLAICNLAADSQHK